MEPNRKVAGVQAGTTLRIKVTSPFRLHWTADEWQSINDTQSKATPIGIDYVDIPIALEPTRSVRFTFFWLSDERWEGKDYAVNVSTNARTYRQDPRVVLSTKINSPAAAKTEERPLAKCKTCL